MPLRPLPPDAACAAPDVTQSSCQSPAAVKTDRQHYQVIYLPKLVYSLRFTVYSLKMFNRSVHFALVLFELKGFALVKLLLASTQGDVELSPPLVIDEE